MHAKRSSSNNLHHRENADRDHQAETQKRSWQPKLTSQPLRSNCVHNLGTTKLHTFIQGYTKSRLPRRLLCSEARMETAWRNHEGTLTKAWEPNGAMPVSRSFANWCATTGLLK